MKTSSDYLLLEQMCSIQATSGNEGAMKNFLLDFIKKNKSGWKHQPKIYHGKAFQDAIVLVFGKPRTAIFAHIDSIGFTVRYGDELIKIGGPVTQNGIRLVGNDAVGPIDCVLKVNKEEKRLSYQFNREIERGTELVFKPNFRETKDFIQSCYLDNRLGVLNALRVAETLKDGIIAFSCWEEHGGGSAETIARFMYSKYKVQQALISDITWVTKGVVHGKGVVVSLRDSGIPRKQYLNRILTIARESKVAFQLEVEGSGGSDGNALQRSAYPIDWCFVGAPEDNVHSPDEKVHKHDVESMLALYRILMKKL